jgi:hypothetical protein
MASDEEVYRQLGGRIGKRIAALVWKAKIDAIHRSAPQFVRTFMHAQDEFFALTGRELRATAGPLWQQIATHPNANEHVAGTAAFLHAGKGQTATLLGVTAYGTAMASGLGDLLTNELIPVTGQLIADNPHARFPPPVAANLAAHGLWDIDRLAHDAAFGGFDRQRFDWLVQSAYQVLTADDILDLLNRGRIDYATALSYMERAGWKPDHADLFLGRRSALLSIQDLAAMANRDIVTDEQGRQLAQLTGWSAADFDRYNLLAGVPPDTTTLILAWRRGVITEAQVDRALIQGPLRKEWIPAVKQLQRAPLTPDEVANAVNQGHMALSDAEKVALQSGIFPQDFAVLIANAGIPPGPQEALNWLRRGLITREDFRGIFLESRLKNKYIDLFLSTTEQLLPLQTIRLMYRHGVMTAERAAHLLAAHGLTQQDVASELALASAQRTQAARDLTVTQILALYEDLLITREDAATRLVTFGYDPDEAEFRLELVDLARYHTFVNAVVNRVKAGFVAGHLDANAATTILDELQLPAAARDRYMTLWGIEREALVRPLTLAQLTAAVKRGLLTIAEYATDLSTMGYSDRDVSILVALSHPAGG